MQICTYPFHSASWEKKQKQNPNARTTLEFPALQTLFAHMISDDQNLKLCLSNKLTGHLYTKYIQFNIKFLHCWHIVQVLP